MRRLARFAPLAIILSACGQSAPPAATRNVLELIEELRVGGLDGPIEYTFGSVAAVAPAPDGTFYVADRQGPVVRKYDAGGTHLFDVGRSGQGPAEYSTLDGLGVSDDGRLMLYDGRNGRLSRFSSDGAFIGSVPVSGGLGGFRSFAYARDGSAYVRVFPEAGFSETPDGIPADWARIGEDGTVDRLMPVPPEERVAPRYVISGYGGYYRPLTTMTVSALGPDGSLYRVRNDEYRIEHEHPDGTLTEIARDEQPVRATDDEISQLEAISEAIASRPGADRSELFPIPAMKPFIRELVVDLDGRLWVSRYTEAVFMEYSEWERTNREERGAPPYQWRDHLRWDVFDPDGAYLGAVTFPFKTTFVTAAGDEVWGIVGGEYEEAYIVRWRLEDGSR
jgi:hypothetical protein